MSMESDTRDRVIRLEAEVAQLTRTVASMNEKLTELHEVFQQAKGARWMVLVMASIGGFLAAKIVPLFSYLLPK